MVIAKIAMKKFRKKDYKISLGQNFVFFMLKSMNEKKFITLNMVNLSIRQLYYTSRTLLRLEFGVLHMYQSRIKWFKLNENKRQFTPICFSGWANLAAYVFLPLLPILLGIEHKHSIMLVVLASLLTVVDAFLLLMAIKKT